MTSTICWDDHNLDDKNGHKTPRSRYFDDVYFNSAGAIAETTYVFIEGNRLYERFISHPYELFVVAETGFGSGLNFLLLWHTFLQFRAQHPEHNLRKLQFFSVEKYPLTQQDYLDIYTELKNEITDASLLLLIEQLQADWGATAYQFNDVSAKILFDDVIHFPAFIQQSANQTHYVDAWFFDGFSPAKNGEMWSADLFSQCYQLTNSHGTFATFSAAGLVRRNLQSAGFLVDKRKGYGIKREMLVGMKN